MSALRRSLAATVLAGAATAGYGGLVERNLFTLRRFAVPVLDPGSPALRVLHISDLHLTAAQERKQDWVSQLATLRPDFVINTGDTSSDPDGIPAILRALGPLFDFPGAFVPGNNDYYVPKPKNPARYFLPNKVGDLQGRRRRRPRRPPGASWPPGAAPPAPRRRRGPAPPSRRPPRPRPR